VKAGVEDCLSAIIKENMMTKRGFKMQLLISASIVFGAIVVAAIALSVLSVNITTTAQTIAAARQTIVDQAVNFGTLDQLKRNASLAATYQSAMSQLLSTRDSLITFPSQVDTLSREDGVSSDFTFNENIISSTVNTPGSAGFTMDVSGPLTNIVAFLKDFEAASPIMLSQIDSATLAGNGSTYTLNVQGKVFFQ
jgi:hypothetical protein